MAGNGTRTQTLGTFKPFIKVGGRTILEWLLRSLSFHVGLEDRFYFVTTQAFQDEFDVQENLLAHFRRNGILLPFELSIAPQTPEGPAASVALAAEQIDRTEAMAVVVNVDQYIQFAIPSPAGDEPYAFMPIYAEFSSKSSYVSIEDGLITRVVEKQNISNLASAGIYGFSSTQLLNEALEAQFNHGERIKGEHYVGPAMNFLIEKGVPVIPAATRSKMDLGNLQGIAEFQRRMVYNDQHINIGVNQCF